MISCNVEKTGISSRIKFLSALMLFGWVMNSIASDRFQLSGRVFDAETGKPIPAVNVFLANTTLGSATDDLGFFRIALIPLGSYELFVTHIGYELFEMHVDMFGEQKGTLEIRLIPKVLQGEAVEISARDLRKWEHNLEIFKREFIGTSQNAESCFLINPRSLEFFEGQKGALCARTDTVLIVRNESLGYRIEIYLKFFSYFEDDFNYLIYPRFEEMSPKDPSQLSKWIKNRHETWEGSLRHFLSVLARNEFKKGLFEVYRAYPYSGTGYIRSYGIPIKSNRPPFIQDEPIEELKRIQFNDFLIVLYKDFTKMHGSALNSTLGRYPTSYLEMKEPFATINIYGNYQPYDAFKVYGAWATQRVADLLPMDYNPDEKKE